MSAALDQVKSTLEDFAAAWKANDGEAVASFYVEDGALINPFGERADGRAALAAMYSDYFGSMLRGTSTTVNLSSVRPIENDHAFADGEQTITAPDGSTVLQVHIAALMRREDDGWRFVDARPYSFATVPD